MFANQTVVSSILVLALYRTGVGCRTHRRRADRRRFGASCSPSCCSRPTRSRAARCARRRAATRCTRCWCRTADIARGRDSPAPDWPLPSRRPGARTAGRTDPGPVHRRSGGASGAAPVGDFATPFGARITRQCMLALLASSVLQLARPSSPPARPGGCRDRLPQRRSGAGPTSRRRRPGRLGSRGRDRTLRRRTPACRDAAVGRPRANRSSARRRRPGLRRRPATGDRTAQSRRLRMSRPGTPGPASWAPASARLR